MSPLIPKAVKTSLPVAGLMVSASLLAATPALAQPNGNVIPGADQTSIVVHTDTNFMTVTVNPADAAATEIKGTVKNNSDNKTFTCAGPRGNGATAGDVTTAKLVAQSEDYYRKNTFRELPKVPIQFGNIPIVGPIKLGELDLGSLGPLLQGLGGLLGDPNADRNKIAKDYSNERVKGHAGLIDKFTVKPGESVDFSAFLNNPSSGPRTDFDAAAFIMCTDETKAAYAFTGYEEGTRKTGDAFFGSPGLPSLQSPGLQGPGSQSPEQQIPGSESAAAPGASDAGTNTE